MDLYVTRTLYINFFLYSVLGCGKLYCVYPRRRARARSTHRPSSREALLLESLPHRLSNYSTRTAQHQ